MKIVKGFPPNWEYIKRFFPESAELGAIYCYGDTVYNPTGKEIPPDIEYHETIHVRQQRECASPEAWWTKYCLEPNFREEVEVEAYAHQYALIKKHVPKAAPEALEDFAGILAGPIYNLPLTKYQVFTRIRLKAKEVEI